SASLVPSIANPCSRMAARWAPRAMKVTSAAPPRTSRPPKKPPTPPDPITAMRTFILPAPGLRADKLAHIPEKWGPLLRYGYAPARHAEGRVEPLNLPTCRHSRGPCQAPRTILEALTETPHIGRDRTVGEPDARPEAD